MSVIAKCATLTSTGRELDAYRAEIAATCSEFTASLNALVNSEEARTANKLADDAFSAANTMFQGNLTSVLDSAGLTKPNETFEESWRNMMDEGYLFSGSRVYFAATRTWKMHKSGGNSVYKYIGVGDGEYDLAQLQALLPGYAEPNYETVIKSLHARRMSATGTAAQSLLNPSALGSVYDGNVATLRDLYIGCGSDKATLKRVLVEWKRRSWGIVWSVPATMSVLRPNAVTVAAFTPDRARELAQVTVSESNVVRVNDDEYMVMFERHVAHDCTRSEAWAKGVAAGILESTGDAQTLIPRLVTFSIAEDLRNGAPLFVSSGFDGTKLGTGAYLIGVMAQGVARVVDVTNDGGQLLSTDAYTAASVAQAIGTVFPDLIETGVVGNEWFATLKTSGTDAVLGFFAVDAADACAAVGISARVTELYAKEFGLNALSLLEIPGGVASPSGIPSSLMHSISGFQLLDVQRQAVLGDPSTYWVDIESELNQRYTTIRNGLTDNTVDMTTIKSTVALVNFQLLEDVRLAECLDILNMLGTDFDTVMRGTTINALDTYTDSQTVSNSLRADFAALGAGDGYVTSSAENQQITVSPRESNQSQAALLFLLGSAVGSLKERDDTDAATGFQITLTDAASTATAETASKSFMVSLERSFTSLARRADDYTAIINRIPTSLQGLVDAAAGMVDAAITSYLRKNFPEEYRKFGNAINDIRDVTNGITDWTDDELSEAYGHVKDLQRMLASANSFGLRQLQKVQAILTLATPMLMSYANAYQTTYKKLAALTNMNANLFKSVGATVSTKLISCHVEGGASLATSIYLEKYLNLLNAGITALNKLLQTAIAAVRKLKTKLDCSVGAIKSAAAGEMSYTTNFPYGGGAVSLAVTCSTHVDVQIDASVLILLTSLCDQIEGIMRMFDVHLATFTAQTTCNESMTKQGASELMTKFELSLDSMGKCLGS